MLEQSAVHHRMDVSVVWPSFLYTVRQNVLIKDDFFILDSYSMEVISFMVEARKAVQDRFVHRHSRVKNV